MVAVHTLVAEVLANLINTLETTRSAQGVAVMSLKRKAVVESAAELEKTPISNVGRYSARTLPAAGALVRPEDIGETQMKLDI